MYLQAFVVLYIEKGNYPKNSHVGFVKIKSVLSTFLRVWIKRAHALKLTRVSDSKYLRQRRLVILAL